MAAQFINIQNKRYRLTNIKRYEPVNGSNMSDKYVLLVYFTAVGSSQRVTHRYPTKKQRDQELSRIDEIFQV